MFRGFVTRIELTLEPDASGFQVRIHHVDGKRKYIITKHADSLAHVGAPVEAKWEGPVQVYAFARRLRMDWVGTTLSAEA